MDSIPVDSVLVILGPFRNLPKFCGMEITILAGSTAKIPFCRILESTRFNQIPADSSRNTCIRKRGIGFKATQSILGVSENIKNIKDLKHSGKSQVKVYLELNL